MEPVTPKHELDAIKAAAADFLAYSKQVDQLFAKVAKDLRRDPNGLKAFEAFAKGSRRLPINSPVFDGSRVSGMIEAAHSRLLAAYRLSFSEEIRQEGKRAGIAAAPNDEGCIVGPFQFRIDPAFASAQALYARSTIGSPVACDPREIVKHAAMLKAEVVDAEINPRVVGEELKEAMRVAYARNTLKPAGRELRVELPAVYREWALTRLRNSRATAERVAAASTARFVVEVKKYMQSETQIKATNPLRLEPAVIENSKDPRKSLLVPKDLNQGQGEGTYFQALVQDLEAS